LIEITKLRQLHQEINDKNDHIQIQYKTSLTAIETLTLQLEEASSTALNYHNKIEELTNSNNVFNDKLQLIDSK